MTFSPSLVTTAHRDLAHVMNPHPTTHIKNLVCLTYFTGENCRTKKVGVNMHFQARWGSQHMWCSFRNTFGAAYYHKWRIKMVESPL